MYCPNFKNGDILQRLFWIIIIISFIAWIIALVKNPQGRQIDLFFLHMGDFWADATNPTGIASARDPYHNAAIGLENVPYPPLTYLFFYYLSKLCIVPTGRYIQYYFQPMWTMMFTIGLNFTLILLFLFCYKQFDSKNRFDGAMISLVCCCLSFPILFTIERGNTLIFTVLLVSVFIFYYDSCSCWKKELALLCIALATAGLKISPGVFCALLIYNKDWRAILRVIIYSLIIFFVPFFFFRGGIQNLSQLLFNIKLNLVIYADLPGPGLIASYLKYSRIFLGENYKMSDMLYLFFMVLRSVISVILVLGAFCYEEKWKRVFNLTIVLLVFPSVSQTYATLYMIPFTILFTKMLYNRELSIDVLIIYICLIMVYFVYRHMISDFLNYNFAVPLLVIVAFCYSIKSIKNSVLKRARVQETT